jgi:50S ribosomal subunit-associated GTPase HflX
MPDLEQVKFFARRAVSQRARMSWELAELFYRLHRPVRRGFARTFGTLGEYFRWRRTGKGGRNLF